MHCCIHCDCIILLLTIIPAYRSGKYFLNYIVERAIIYGFLYALLYALLLTIIAAYRSGNFCFFLLLLLHRLRVDISFEMVFIKLMLTWGYFHENKLHIYFNQLVLLQSIVLACYILAPHYVYTQVPKVCHHFLFPLNIWLKTRLTFRRFSVVILCLILQKFIVTKRRFNLNLKRFLKSSSI